MTRYFTNLLVALDQLLNAILAGDPDETLSSRCGKRVATVRLCRCLCTLLDAIDPRHCQKHIEHDEGKSTPWPID